MFLQFNGAFNIFVPPHRNVFFNQYKEPTMDQQGPMSASQSTQPSSFVTRVVNVFASPSELWSEVAAMPVQKSSWVVPYVLSLVLVLVFTFALFHNDILRNQIYDVQMEGMRKAVAEGRMSASQMESMEEGMRGSGLGMFMLFGGVSQVFMLSVMFFGMALFLWLAAKFGLKAQAGYGKFLEVSGLVTCIGILGAVVTLLLMYAMDSLHASPSVALAVIDAYDAKDTVHRILSQLNVVSLWETAVVGIALSRISGKSTGAGMGVAFALWAVWSIIVVAFGFGFR
jgi:hypothetical protein